MFTSLYNFSTLGFRSAYIAVRNNLTNQKEIAMKFKMNAEALIAPPHKMEHEIRHDLTEVEQGMGFSVFLHMDDTNIEEPHYTVEDLAGKELIRISAIDKSKFHLLMELLEDLADKYMKNRVH
ncbi:MAG: hypothetical protein CM15mV86_450 [uncultured marine virus]|nr:MAG: hypothetical protein CM15mV86_450 [uncultured marine virus]